MSVKSSCKSTLAFVLVFLFAIRALLIESVDVYTQGQIKAIYRFPDASIAKFQNASFPGSVTNNHRELLGSMGSDLWRSSSDAPGEFWMVADRALNGQIPVDGKNRGTFWVLEFNPTILRVKTEGDWIRMLQSIPPSMFIVSKNQRNSIPAKHEPRRNEAFRRRTSPTNGLDDLGAHRLNG